MVRAKQGRLQFTAKDFNDIILYFNLRLEDIIVSPVFLQDKTEYLFIDKHSWKLLFHINDQTELIHVDSKLQWFEKGATIKMIDILIKEPWTRLFLKEIFNVQY